MPNPELPVFLNMLGSPRLRSDRVWVDLPDALPSYLLAYLAARGDWVLREELAALLWPEAALDDAQRNLRVNLNRLRTFLRERGLEPALQAERRRLRLDVANDVAALRQACTSRDWAAAAAHEGRFLEGLSFRAFGACGDWARQFGEHLRAEWRDALMHAAADAAPPQVLALTDRLDRFERLAEPVQRLRLMALLALGRAADAAPALAGFRIALKTEFDAVPSLAFDAWAHQLLAPLLGVAPGALTPDAPDALIGRADDLREAGQQLRSSRLLTIVGLGGVGKTTLARAMLASAGAEFDGGQRWLSLSGLASPAEVLPLLADAVGAAPTADRVGLAALTQRLGRGRWLLVFDNAEHLLDESGALPRLLDALRAGCPQLHLLVTSREPLGLAAESVLRLRGLALSSTAEQLFVTHARRIDARFDATAAASHVARIAELTGGLPLALRMAAGWLRWLGPAQVAEELQSSLDVLEPASDQGRGEMQGVRATVERSWQRLPPLAARALAWLSVFAGPFEAAAAREVAEAGLQQLSELAEVSMIEIDREASGARFHLHPLVRQMALARLNVDHGAGVQARAAHRRWLQRTIAPMTDWRRIDQRAALQRIATLLDELRAGWRSAVEDSDPVFLAMVAPVMMRFFEQKGVWNEALGWFEPAQSHFDPSVPAQLAALAALARAQALMLYRKTDLDAAELVAGRALVWSRALGHGEGLKSILNTLGLTLLMQGRTTEARAHFEEAAAIAAADGDAAGEAVFRANLALADKRVGHYAAAALAWQRSLALHREVGNWRSAVNVLSNLGNLLRIEGKLEEAKPLLEEGLRLCDEHGYVSTRLFLLVNLARLHADAGRDDDARRLAEATLADLGNGETMLEAGTLLVLTQLALRAEDSAGAAQLLARALHSTSGTGDIANRLEAMELFGHWLASRGEPVRAGAVWRVLLDHPALHAELRTLLQRHLATFAAAGPEPATGAACGDFTAWCEVARGELERAAVLTIPQ